MTRPTSTQIDSFLEIQESGAAQDQKTRILDALRFYGPMTRAELETHFAEHRPRIRLSAICGRVRELLDEDHPRIRIQGTTLDRETNRRVEVLESIPRQMTQGRLL